MTQSNLEWTSKATFIQNGSSSLEWPLQSTMVPIVQNGISRLEWPQQYRMASVVQNGSTSLECYLQPRIVPVVQSGSSSIEWPQQFRLAQLVYNGLSSQSTMVPVQYYIICRRSLWKQIMIKLYVSAHFWWISMKFNCKRNKGRFTTSDSASTLEYFQIIYIYPYWHSNCRAIQYSSCDYCSGNQSVN